MTNAKILFFLILILAAAPIAAESQDEKPLPAVLNLLISSTKNGVLVRMPIVDNDPNRGVTFGFMPVWVCMTDSGTIQHIHVPNVTYNPYVGAAVTYEYFSFLSPESNIHFLASTAEKYERQILYEYSTSAFLEHDMKFDAHLEYSRDGSGRYFGIGPNTPRSGESNYTLDTLNYRFSGGVPFRKDSPFSINLRHQFQANEIRPGAITQPEDLQNRYPDVGTDLQERHRDASLRTFLTYDTRDSPITTSRGSYATVFIEGAHKDVLGQYSYYRYGAGIRQFWPTYNIDDREPKFITAARIRIEDLKGTAPFWALPQLGGKYVFRGYGAGRYIDHGMIIFAAEERCRLYAVKFSGVAASFWADPFFEMGTVFPSPERMQAENLRPVAGISLRAVGRPQIVGSADFGYGQEGLKIFLDINYTY